MANAQVGGGGSGGLPYTCPGSNFANAQSQSGVTTCGTGVAAGTLNAGTQYKLGLYPLAGSNATLGPTTNLTDNGSVFTTGEDIDYGVYRLLEERPNDAATGTTANTLTTLTTAGSAIIVSHTGGPQYLGIVTSGAGKTGNAQIAVAGQPSLVFDGATTAGDIVQASTTVDGNGHDSGAATCPTNSAPVVGMVLSTHATGGTYSIQMGSFGCGAGGLGTSTNGQILQNSAGTTAGLTLGGAFSTTGGTLNVVSGGIASTMLAAGAASANIGTLGGVLGGTLPNPTMAAGAAATNIGQVGGDVSGTLPNILVTGLQGRAVSGVPTNNQVLTYNAGLNSWVPATPAAIFLTASTPDLVFTPSPILSTGTIGSTVSLNQQSGSSYSVGAGDVAKTVVMTSVSATTVSVPAATGATWGAGPGFDLFAQSGGITAAPTTSVVNGLSTLKMGAYQGAKWWSDGTNWHTLLGVPMPSSQTGTTFLRDDMTWQVGGGASGMTAGQVAIAGSSTQITTSKPLSGNGGAIASTTGTLTSGDIVKIDASGNFIDSGTNSAGIASVGLSAPTGFGVTGSPVAGAGASGTLGLTLTTENANTVWAGPGTGSPAQPGFRNLVVADLPASIPLTGLASQSANSVVANVTAGLAAPAAATLPGCTDVSGNHLNYTPGTGFSCGSTSSSGSPLSGMTAGQIPVAADASHVTSSAPQNTWLFSSGANSALSGTGASCLTVDGTGAITRTGAACGSGGSGSVTSVGMTVPTGFTIGGSPVTTSGTLALGLSTEANNVVFAGPTTGGPLAPTFRALANSDLPGAGSLTLGTTSLAINSTTTSVAGLTLTGSPSLALRDTSAAFDVTLGATSSPALSAGRALTFDVENGARTVHLGSTLTVNSDPGGVTGALKSNGSGTFTQAACGDLSNAGTGCTGTLPLGANPTATIGATASNGSATTFMRSDAAPPIGAGAVTTALLGNGAATYAKMQNGSTTGLLAVNNGGAPTEAAVGNGLKLSGGALTTSGTITNPAVTATLTAAQWNQCAGFVFENAGVTLTLPAYSAVTGNANGCFWIATVGVKGTVAINPSPGTDVIKTGSGAGSTSPVILPANLPVTIVTIDSAGFVVALGPTLQFQLSWGANQNLSTPTGGVSLGRVSAASTVYSIICRPDVVVGGTATLDVYTAPSGTALNAGTKLDTTACDANTGANTEQSMGVASASIPSGNWMGVVASGAGWGSSAGWGAITVNYR